VPRISSAPLERSGALGRSRHRLIVLLGAYLALTKPRIIEQLLITTVPVMFLAQEGVPGLWLMVVTVIGGALAAGGANAINMVIDRDIDTVMHRTRNRPLVTGVLRPRSALVFAIGIEALAFALLWWQVNLLSAVLALAACLFYVFVYTLWLKRTSRQNIVIGGAAGAVPVLIGWAAVRNEMALAPWLLFALIFFWTPPHFWALAVKYRDDYSKANVPMLPSVASFRDTARQIVAYSVIVVAISACLPLVARTGPLYLVAAAVLGVAFLGGALRLAADGTPGRAIRFFAFSNVYLSVLFIAIAVDQLVR
jgi:protoheme IX farnesyltransferase